MIACSARNNAGHACERPAKFRVGKSFDHVAWFSCGTHLGQHAQDGIASWGHAIVRALSTP